MNKSEKNAFDWLVRQGVSPTDIIFQESKSPDFLLADGRRFEVKRLYAKKGQQGKILFSPRQLQYLRELDNVEVLVFTDDGADPVEIVPTKALQEGATTWRGVVLYEWGQNRKPAVNVTIDQDLVKWVDRKVQEKKYASRSHAVNVALTELRKMEVTRF